MQRPADIPRMAGTVHFYGLYHCAPGQRIVDTINIDAAVLTGKGIARR